MSKYTTGEIAKLCGVTVRTVQYYDTRNLLLPSELSEGGRRLYSEEDLQRMRIICFLRELGLPINAIGQLLAEEHPENVIDLLLTQQEQELKEEIDRSREKLEKLQDLRKGLKTLSHISVEAIGDVAMIMENKKKMRRVRWTMVGIGLALELVEIGTILLYVLKGILWPFLGIGMPLMLVGIVGLVCYYYKKVAYICPQCHQTFVPGFWEMFFARHTPTTRRLTCTHCGHKGFCVETYNEDKAQP